MINFKLIFKIILPALLCVFFLKFIKDDIYYALTFGLIVGFVNWDLHRYNKLLGLLLSVVLSNIVYFSSAFVFIFITKILTCFKFDVINLPVNDILYTIITFIVAPLLLFYAYRFVFNIQKNKSTLWIIIISIFTLVLVNILPIEDDKDNLLNLYSLWQVIMALGIQLILYQKEVMRFFYKNK